MFSFSLSEKNFLFCFIQVAKRDKKNGLLGFECKKGKILASQLQLLLIHLDLRGYRGKEVQNETSAVL